MELDHVKYGVVGFSENHFDRKRAHHLLNELFSRLQKLHATKTIEIVSGYTNIGVPKIAYELADKYGFVTLGFSAQQALEAKAGVYPVQKVMIEGLLFGDESEAFVAYVDCLIRLGGGAQSRKEVEMFKEKCAGQSLDGLLIEYEL